MERYIVLESSEFKLSPPSGRLVYKKPAGSPAEEDLVSGEEIAPDFPYELLNPLQTLFYRKYREGNALVTAPTSGGKSLIAYLFMKDRPARKVYIAPTKALVYEKVTELRRLFKRRVDVRTGDVIELYRNARSDVVVATYENFALALRNRLSWATETDCVVIDEIHHLMGSRGWVLEEIVSYLLESEVEILGLSATLPGSDKLAKWIRAKLFIESLWRPVPLERKVIPLKEFKEFTEAKDQEERMAAKLLSALYELRNPDDQVILFVHKKSIGWKVLELANRERIGVMNETVPFERIEKEDKEIAFHNADIPKEEREEIEKAFREGKLKNLVATHTLAYGVNLPADTVLISVRAFWDRKQGEWKIFPQQLDILQMEGRAGRLGIKEKGFSYILPYGASPQNLKREIERSVEGEFNPQLRQMVKGGYLSEDLEKVLSLFVLIGFLYEGRNFKNFLRKTYSLRDLVEDPLIDDVYEWLEERGYIERSKLSDKALFCIRSGMSPINYEEFLRRKLLNLETLVVIRPLLFVKRFEGLYEFIKEMPNFPADDVYIRDKLSPCGIECFRDNTHQFLFYIEGLTFKYPNIQHPPGEFSYLGTDALHLIRTLLEIRKFGDISWSNGRIMAIAHSVKYGLTEEFAPLGGIKGIGHIRANLLKRLMVEEGIKVPPLGSPTEELLGRLSEEVADLEGRLVDLLLEHRFEDQKEKAKKEAKAVLSRLRANEEGFLVDDRILRTFGMFHIGPEAIRMPKAELIGSLL